MRDVEHLLVSLAIYIEQARHDEVIHVTDHSQSLANDIQLIEEQGIYHLLCSIRIGGSLDSGTAAAAAARWWDEVVARGVMLLGCSAFEHQAPVDNRNYMTFYTLDRLLLRIMEYHARSMMG